MRRRQTARAQDTDWSLRESSSAQARFTTHPPVAASWPGARVAPGGGPAARRELTRVRARRPPTRAPLLGSGRGVALAGPGRPHRHRAPPPAPSRAGCLRGGAGRVMTGGAWQRPAPPPRATGACAAPALACSERRACVVPAGCPLAAASWGQRRLRTGVEPAPPSVQRRVPGSGAAPARPPASVPPSSASVQVRPARGGGRPVARACGGTVCGRRVRHSRARLGLLRCPASGSCSAEDPQSAAAPGSGCPRRPHHAPAAAVPEPGCGARAGGAPRGPGRRGRDGAGAAPRAGSLPGAAPARGR